VDSYSPFKISKNQKQIGKSPKQKYNVQDDNPYSIEWAKKILFENYNCHIVEHDMNKRKLKLVKANTK